MMLAYHALRPAGDEFVADLNRRFNATRAARDWAEPSYRACFLLSKTRTQEDLTRLGNSLRDGDNQPLRAEDVLPLGQILFQIAHQGAVVRDKDRHIRNLAGGSGCGCCRSPVYHITGFGQRGRIHNCEGDVEHLGQGVSEQGLA